MKESKIPKFKNRISALANNNQIGLTKLAYTIDVDPSSFSRMLSGDKNIPIEVIQKLSDFFSVSIDRIIEETEYFEALGNWVQRSEYEKVLRLNKNLENELKVVKHKHKALWREYEYQHGELEKLLGKIKKLREVFNSI